MRHHFILYPASFKIMVTVFLLSRKVTCRWAEIDKGVSFLQFIWWVSQILPDFHRKSLKIAYSQKKTRFLEKILQWLFNENQPFIHPLLYT